MTAAALYPDLKGRHALVTGGAQGIGLATVEAMIEQGMRVSILDIDEAGGEDLCRRHGDALVFRKADMRDLAATRHAVEQCTTLLGPVSVLVNNAANDTRHAFETVTPDYWDDRMAINLRHMMFVTQAVVPAMRLAGRASIVNMGSTSWMQGAPGMIAYTTAKAAIIGFTRSLARELGADGIRVNCVTPGWVMTERQLARASAEQLASAQARQSIKGSIMPSDIAAMILFLASDVSRMCSGQNYIVDAGVV